MQSAENSGILLLEHVLRCHKRKKDGKEHRYYSVVESRRLQSGKVVQRQVLYLGEINDSQQAAWRKTLEVFDEEQQRSATESVSRRPAGPAERRHGASEAQRDEVAASAAVRQLLVGMRAVAAVGIGSVLGTEAPRRDGKAWLGQGAGIAGGESVDRSGQRVPGAPAVVRSERHGRVAGGGFCGGGKGPAVPVPGSECWKHKQELFAAFAAALEGSVPCPNSMCCCTT